MPSSDKGMLKVSERRDHTRIEVREPCSVRWSVDCTIWHEFLTDAPVGTVFEDYDAGEGNRRSYSAALGDRTVEVYYERGAREQFARMMRPWFPSRGERHDHL